MRKIGLAILLLSVVLLVILLGRGRTGGPDTPQPDPERRGVAQSGRAETPAGEQDVVTTEAIDLRRTGRLRILVAGAGGPAPDARIEVRPAEGPARILRTDGNGVASLDAVPAGKSEVRTEAEGFAIEDSQASVPLGGLVVLEVSLRHPRVLTGTVVRADGIPVPGARVRLFEPAGGSLDGMAWEQLDNPLGKARTGADGRFRTESRPGSISHSALFLVEADGFRTTLFHGRDGIRIPLAPGCVLEGRVVNSTGRPIAGVRVTAVPATHRILWREDVAIRRSVRDAEEEAVVPITTRTDAAGRYRLTGFGRGEPYLVRFHGEGFSFREIGEVTPPGDGLDVTLLEGGSVRATVRDGGGRPIAGARVQVTGPWTRWFPGAETGVDGRALVGGLPCGQLDVRGSAAGFRYADVRVTLRDGSDVEAEIVLTPGTGRTANQDPPPTGDETLEGLVVFPDGEPVSRGWVTVQPWHRRTVIEADGSFRIDFLPPGKVEVTADPYLGEDVRTLAALPGQPLRILVPRMPAVRGRLVLPPGAAAPGRVTARWPRGSTSFSWRPEADGACPFHLCGDPGPCSMEFRADGFRPLTWEGEIPESGIAHAGSLVFDAGRALTVRVVTEAGTAVAGAEIGVGKPGRATHRVRTGPAGVFRLTGLGPEPTLVHAVADGFLGAERVVTGEVTELELMLSRGVRVLVSVVTEDGDPIRGATVELRPLAPGRERRTVVTGSVGVAEFRVVPGNYRINAVVDSLTMGGEARSVQRQIDLEVDHPVLRVELVPR